MVQLHEAREPYLSIVIPMYNRAAFIRRAIDSCLQSSFQDHEIIVVDDASTDDSVSVVSDIDQPRIRLLRHDINRGLGATRNTGIRNARGQWVISLDSDDELTEGALDVVQRCSLEVPSDVAVLWFRCRMDDGSLTPRPCPQEGIWRYDNWLSFCETIIAAGPEGESEMLLVIRRNIHEDFHFNETTAPEDLFYFDVHKNYRSRFYPTTLRLYHQDADNRVTTEYSSGVGRLRAEAESDELIRLLEKHGQALAQTAPRAYAWYLARMGASAFRCGRKLQGSAACLRALYRQPLQPRVMGMMIAGVLGSPAFEAIRASHRRRPA